MSTSVTIDTISTMYATTIDDAVEEYMVCVEALNERFMAEMQSADFQLKHILSDTTTQDWAKCTNLTNSYITEMLRNIGHPDDNSQIANDSTNNENISTLFNQDANFSYTEYRNVIMAAKETYNLTIEKCKQQLYNTITHAHNDRHTAITAIQKSSITLDNGVVSIDFPTIDSEFTMALNLANLRLNLSHPDIF